VRALETSTEHNALAAVPCYSVTSHVKHVSIIKRNNLVACYIHTVVEVSALGIIRMR
jgi:hypothetical protein